MQKVTKAGKSALISVPKLNTSELLGLSIVQAFSLVRDELVLKGLVRGDLATRTRLVETGKFVGNFEVKSKFITEGLVSQFSSGQYAWGDWEHRNHGIRTSCALTVTDMLPGSDKGRVLFAVRQKIEGYDYPDALDPPAASRGFVPDGTFKIDGALDGAIIQDLLEIGVVVEYNIAGLSAEEKEEVLLKIDKDNASEGIIDAPGDERLIYMPVYMARVSPEDIDRALNLSQKARAYTFEEISFMAKNWPAKVTGKFQVISKSLAARQPQHYFQEIING